MTLIQAARIKPPLPKVTALILLIVEIMRIAHVHPLQNQRKRIGMQWNRNKMHVVVHQAIRPNLQAKFPAIIPQPGQVSPSICIVLHNHLAKITTLSDVIRKIGRYDSSYSWHSDKILSYQEHFVKNKESVPIIVYGSKEMTLIQATRIKPPLPKVTALILLIVEIMRIAHVHPLQNHRKRIGMQWE
jgi:hypothetical protein